MTVTSARRAPAPGRPRAVPYGWIYLFLLPTLLLYGVYTVWPVLASWWYSFLEWPGFGADKTFVGLANYAAVLDDPLFWNSFGITMLFMVVTVPLRVGLGLLLALAVSHPRLPWQGLFRSAFFVPAITTTAIIGVVMQFVLDPSSGPVTVVLEAFGITDVDLLGSAGNAIWTVVGVHTWKWVGITMIYWLAALQTVPRETIEAAQVDGATGWTMCWRIRLPLLLPFLVIITLLTVEQNLQIFDLMLTMTGGGPYFSTEVIELYVYRWAFTATVPELGFASAAAVLFGVFLIGVGVVQLLGARAARRLTGATS
ncbi:carbohydrate ABC transporter permease [Pseudonocardia sp. HH130630-07]|uniref:carbohydrate ABC transporter permease n=1 Tax=Pseudonocardia sp. HH130630-07 TaxID=1690815 RepID=UPI000814BFC6|nr:sugar ABC transporter permease [Pseudonocardia sp. HH130630-07]ANY07713.1 ABC transporter permease [Pseudonocardia sp. HH130630-07]